jgi:isopentenyl-diphosphate delta-isomerase
MKKRKNDHIDLALNLESQKKFGAEGLYYEPLLKAHPPGQLTAFEFLGKTQRLPLWVSSMTGGGDQSLEINRLLARACKDFKMGMGVGSCRVLLDDHSRLQEFALRPYLGDAPYYANLGIAQIEQLLLSNRSESIDELIKRLEADGLIIHINPLQEFLQPEGDRIKVAPIETIEKLLEQAAYPIIVKEVGQGIGPRSLRKLMALPIAAIEFGAFGGTNFSTIELLRHQGKKPEASPLWELTEIGHTAQEMVRFINDIHLKDHQGCREFIISGGMGRILEAWALSQKLKYPSVIGQGRKLLEKCLEGEESLYQYLEDVEKCLLIADQVMERGV